MNGRKFSIAEEKLPELDYVNIVGHKSLVELLDPVSLGNLYSGLTFPDFVVIFDFVCDSRFPDYRALSDARHLRRFGPISAPSAVYVFKDCLPFEILLTKLID